MHVMWRAFRGFVRRALLSFGPVIAVTVGFIGMGAYATTPSAPEPRPDLSLIHLMTPSFERGLDRVPVLGTGGRDVILIARRSHDTVRVSVNGCAREYRVGEGRTLLVRGRGGDDSITALGDVPASLALCGGGGDDVLVGGTGDDLVLGGSGDDVIEPGSGDDLVGAGAGADVVRLGPGNDEAEGGDGGDRIAGGAGDDYLQGDRGADDLDGEEGDDVLYGLGGRDRVIGGAGDDYIDGGAGDDVADGEGGRDLLFGGTGSDVLADESGGDLLAGGGGHDVYLAVGSSSIVAPAREGRARLPVVAGPAGDGSFVARVVSDLAVLRSLPPGRELLAALTASGHRVTIRATAEGNATTWDGAVGGYADAGGRPGPGTGSTVLYDPYRMVVGDGRQAWQHRPPIVGLFHELVHALAVANGAMPADAGRQQAQAVGAAFDRETGDQVQLGVQVDATPPASPTENSLRAYLGLPLRPPE